MNAGLRTSLSFALIASLALCWAPCFPAALWADSTPDPLVYFAGEDLSVLTVASRRPESPQRAPAVVRVVTAQDIQSKGYRTLADVLRGEAGFVIRPGERGSTPYLRGIREGILFLYDGVPLHSNVTKSIHPLDEELSMDPIERVEIVLGPGSVLWGSDAYAGVVNVVPFKAVGDSGGHLRAWGGTQNDRGAGCALAAQRGPVAARLTVSGEKRRYWDDTFPASYASSGGASRETDTVDASQFWEAVGTLTVGDRLSFTGRLTDSRNRFTMAAPNGLSWLGEKRAPVSFLKGTALHRLGGSDLTLNASYAHVQLDLTDADVARSQEDDIFTADVLWYRPLGEGGGITAGLGYRQDRTRNALVRDGFLPDYLKPPYRVFAPPVVQADFHNHVGSAFAQVRRRFGPVDVWAGMRYDDPNAYEDSTTFSGGAVWNFWENWRLKASLGTAYRHPYAAQLYTGRSMDPEGIRTASLELGWYGTSDKQWALTLFHSALSDHLQEDPYGGLSQPSDHSLFGAEIQGKWRLHPRLDIYGAAMAVGGGDERVDYRVLKAFFLAPDGTLTPIEDRWSAPLDVGPEWSASAVVRWRFREGWSVVLEGLFTGSWAFSADQGRTTGRFDGERNLRAFLLVQDVGMKGSSLQVTADNLLDRGGSVPGVYGPAQRPPFRLWVEWRWDF